MTIPTQGEHAQTAPGYEHQRAIMEGERNASLDSYSRVVYLTSAESRLYEAAFTNGWDRHAAQVAALTAAEPVVPAAWRKRIDNAAKAMSLIQASNNLGDLETMSSHALAGLRAIQSTYVLDTAQPAAPQGVAYAVKFTDAHASYIARYGGNCRDCADENGVCPGSGLPCGGARKAIKFVLDALTYGITHGYIDNPFGALRASHGQAPAGAAVGVVRWAAGIEGSQLEVRWKDGAAPPAGAQVYAHTTTAQAAPAAGAVAGPSLHDQIMNIPLNQRVMLHFEDPALEAYKIGHREARHAAAELALAAAPTPAAKTVHGDDVAVDVLAGLMKAKLSKQRAKGYGGWDSTECTQQHLSNLLREHVAKGDPVDVANFCAFLSARGEGVAPTPATQAADPWREHMASQAEAIDCEALLRAMVKHGISFPEGGMEYFRASLGEMVNRFVRHATPAAQADSITKERLKELLGKPETVHLNMLNGNIAVITMEQCAHLHGEEMQRKWAAADSVLEDAAHDFPELTPELASILGTMCFQCIHFAQALRAAGHQIKTRAEDEQAAVLHWMLGHYFRHGDDGWRKAAAEEMKRMQDAARKQGGTHD